MKKNEEKKPEIKSIHSEITWKKKKKRKKRQDRGRRALAWKPPKRETFFVCCLRRVTRGARRTRSRSARRAPGRSRCRRAPPSDTRPIITRQHFESRLDANFESGLLRGFFQHALVSSARIGGETARDTSLLNEARVPSRVTCAGLDVLAARAGLRERTSVRVFESGRDWCRGE